MQPGFGGWVGRNVLSQVISRFLLSLANNRPRQAQKAEQFYIYKSYKKKRALQNKFRPSKRRKTGKLHVERALPCRREHSSLEQRGGLGQELKPEL